MTGLRQDFRYALRGLRQRPGFTERVMDLSFVRRPSRSPLPMETS